MAGRIIKMQDLVELYEHWQAGRGIRAIARSLGMSRGSVKKYLKFVYKAGISRHGQKLTPEEWSKFIHENVIPEQKKEKVSSSVKLIKPYHEEIRTKLNESTMKTIWSRLCKEKDLKISYLSFFRYCKKYFAEELLRKKVTVIRKDDPAPGEETQIDLARLGYWLDPLTDKRKLLWVFMMVLSFSRHMFVRIIERVNLTNWIECHCLGAEFFGGVSARWVCDNLKDGVIRPDIYDPQFNRTYDELAHHYGVIIDPCRSGKPKDKPRVERSVPYIRDSFFSGREFESIEEMNEKVLQWCIHQAGHRNHGTTHKPPIEVFHLVEQQALNPLPEKPFEMSQWFHPKVHPDSRIMVNGAEYSVPWGYIGKEVDVKVTAKLVEIYYEQVLIKTHLPVGKGKRQIDYNDYPPEKVQFYQRTPQWCISQSEKIGSCVYQVVEELLQTKAFYYLRQCQGIIRLAEKYGNKRLDDACRRAVEFGDPTYRTIKGILQGGYDRQNQGTEIQISGVDAYLRGPEEIFSGLFGDGEIDGN